jgi:sulfotransferase
MESIQMKKYAFMSGLPRSGSTLLASILNQNPEVHSSPNSPICGMMWHLEQSIIVSEPWTAYPKPDVLPGVVRGVLEAFYADTDCQLVIDKNREWAMPQNFELLQRNMPYEPRIIVTVRSIVEILASFINLVHENEGRVSFIDKEIEANKSAHFYKHPDEVRCSSLMRPQGPIDNALYGVMFACQPENRRFFHFVEYDSLVSNTEEVMNGIYDFLEMDRFKHDFSSIQNKFHENDAVYGLKGMHDVGQNISRSNVDIAKVLPQSVIFQYANMEFWRNRGI